MKLNNPFIIAGYSGPKYFCDRQKETATILDAVGNERNLTLVSPRRMGKTGLIKNVFYFMERKEKVLSVYMDIFSTQNLREFVRLFASSVLGAFDTNAQKLIAKIGKVFKNCRPTIVFDELTGLPQISVDILPDKEEASLKEIFEYIGSGKRKCMIAIDEFQQIAAYPERGVEALLRSYIQFVPNARFIFAGSRQHIMQEIFLSAKRPFYQSTQILTLEPIDKASYYAFANHFFEKKNLSFDRGTFDKMYDEFAGHTWYMQVLLNRLYAYDVSITEKTLVYQAVQDLVDEGAYSYQILMDAYSGISVKLMRAIAKEGIVKEINSGEFISKYSLRAASSVNTALKKLTDREIVYKSPEGYMIYDRFMAIWLKRQV